MQPGNVQRSVKLAIRCADAGQPKHHYCSCRQQARPWRWTRSDLPGS